MDHKIKINAKEFRQKKGRNKLTLVFDENARREFLTGFHKRKLQRKNKAKEEFEKQLKAERKRIKAEAKEQYIKLLLGLKPLPETPDTQSEEIDMGTHAVSVTELSVTDLAKRNNWIGINEVQYQEKDNEKSNEPTSESDTEHELAGMEIEKESDRKPTTANIPGKSSKGIRTKLKQHTTNRVRSSKLFKKKFKLDRIKNIKLKRKQERQAEKKRKKYKSNHRKSNK